MRRLAMAVAGLVLDLADGGQVAELIGRGVLGAVDRDDARRSECGVLVDTGDPGVRMRRAHEQHGERVGWRRVVSVAPLADQEPPILAPCDRLADL